jgi:hypothetical protein
MDFSCGRRSSPNTEAAYNTIVLNGTFQYAIEYRYNTTTGVSILYNLTDGGAITQRDGASATLTGNVITANASWFVNENVGNLNLTAQTGGALGHGTLVPEVPTDYSDKRRCRPARPFGNQQGQLS